MNAKRVKILKQQLISLLGVSPNATQWRAWKKRREVLKTSGRFSMGTISNISLANGGTGGSPTSLESKMTITPYKKEVKESWLRKVLEFLKRIFV